MEEAKLRMELYTKMREFILKLVHDFGEENNLQVTQLYQHQPGSKRDEKIWDLTKRFSGAWIPEQIALFVRYTRLFEEREA